MAQLFRLLNEQKRDMADALAGRLRYVHNKETGEMELRRWKKPKAERPLCGAKCRSGQPCRRRVIEGKNRCRNHGGLSTGPKTDAGRAAIVESNRRRRKHPLPVPPDVTSDAQQAALPSTPTNTLPALETPVQALTEAQERAAKMLGEDAVNDAEIAQQCGVSRRTLARWKYLPAFDKIVQEAYEAAYEARAAEPWIDRRRKEWR